MNIGTASELSGLSTKQIRDYEKTGLLTKVSRNNNGYRHYNEEAIKRLVFIKNARQVDFSINEIKKLLSLSDNPKRDNAEIRAVTTEHIDELNEKVASLQNMITLLETWHSDCEKNPNSGCAILKGLSIEE